ncbi:MAG: WG repeat-containing protein [Bacteroidia bacterium]|nr:WG repeat-containing protein [Bacteroidia bacterium]
MIKIPLIIFITLLYLTVLGQKTIEEKILYPVKQEGYWGYIDSKGKPVIPCIYELAFDFSDGLAAIIKKKLLGYINQKGTVVIKPQYTTAGTFSEGYAAVGKTTRKKGELFSVIDKAGKVITNDTYDEIRSCREGMFAAKKNDLWGFIDVTGKVTIPIQYKSAGDFSEGLAWVEIEKREPPFYISDSRQNGRGYIDKTGKIVIPAIFHDTKNFTNGRALAESIDYKYKTGSGINIRSKGYINKKGEFIIEQKQLVKKYSPDSASGYDHLSWGDFSEGLAKFGIREMEGFIDTSGVLVIPLKYKVQADFKEGFAVIKVKEKMGYIDKTGKIIIQPKYLNAEPFWYGLARVSNIIPGKKVELVFGYINKAGKTIWLPGK